MGTRLPRQDPVRTPLASLLAQAEVALDEPDMGRLQCASDWDLPTEQSPGIKHLVRFA